MDNSKLQIPINRSTLLKSKKRAKQLGFSSINEVVRVFLANFNEGSINISFVNERISDDLADKYQKMADEVEADIHAGKAKVFTNTTELFKELDK